MPTMAQRTEAFQIVNEWAVENVNLRSQYWGAMKEACAMHPMGDENRFSIFLQVVSDQHKSIVRLRQGLIVSACGIRAYNSN